MQLPERVTSLLHIAVRDCEPLGGAVTGDRWQLRLEDGREVFAKTRPGAPEGFFAVEAAGLRWLAAAPGGPPVPEVLGYDRELLVLPWVPPGMATGTAAEAFGRELAALHAAAAPAFGADRDGWIGAAPLDNEPCPSWPEFYARRRIEPYVRRLRDRGDLTAAQADVFARLTRRIDRVAGPPEPPAPLHGDLWSGNVLWSRDGRAWLVDPAAHGGHRETDLAMLELFGVAGLSRLMRAYQEVAPLAAGWEERQALHQVHPLLVHTEIFGRAYVGPALDAAARYT